MSTLKQIFGAVNQNRRVLYRLRDSLCNSSENVANYELLSSVTTWNIPANVSYISVYVSAIGDSGNPPELTTDAGTFDLLSGQTITLSATELGTNDTLSGVFSIETMHANDRIGISYITTS